MTYPPYIPPAKRKKGNPAYRALILASLEGGVFRSVKPIKGVKRIQP